MGRISAIALQRALAEGRRGAARYEIRLPLRYSAVRMGEMPRTGAGESLNISRTGLLLRLDGKLQTGDSIVVVLDWPVPGPDSQLLKLVVTGHVVRTKPHLAGVSIHSHRLMRSRDLKKRGDTLWVAAEHNVEPAHHVPVVWVDEEEDVAALVSRILTPQKWMVERIDPARAEELLDRGDYPLSLLVTRTRALFERLPRQIPAVLILNEAAPTDEAADLAVLPRRAVVRKPLLDDSLRVIIKSLLDPNGRAQGMPVAGAAF